MPRSREAPPWIAAAALAALAAITYARTLGCGWIWDDDANVTACAPVQSWIGLLTIWLHPSAIQQYYPMVHTTFWIEHKLWGLNPAGYHAVNVLLHTLNALLVWALLRRLRLPAAAAWIAAALFAVHPVHVESVAWVTERKNTLSFALYLGSAMLWLRWSGLSADDHRGEGDARLWAASLGLFVLALLSKSVTSTLPVLFLVVAWWKRGALGRRELWLLPFFAAAVAAGFLTLHLEAENVGTARLGWSLTAAERLLTAGRAIWFYAAGLAFPARLAFVYPRWNVDAGAAWQWLFPAGALAVVGALILLRGRIGRGPAAAVIAWLVTLAPMIGLFDIYFFRYSFVSDHFQYHASVAPLALAGLGLAGVGGAMGRRLPGAAGVAPAAVLLILGILSAVRVGAFHDTHTLWTEALAANPGAWIAWNNLGQEALDAGRTEEAEQLFHRATVVDSAQYESWNNLGVCLLDRGRPAEAAPAFERAIATRRANPTAVENLGRALLLAGQPGRAAGVLREVVRVPDRGPLPSLDLVEALLRNGEVTEAETTCRAAGARFTADPRFNVLLSMILRRRGALAEAEEVLRGAAARSGRQDPVVLDALATTLAAAGRFGEAAQIVEEALALHVAPEADAALRKHLEAIRAASR